MSLNHHKFNQSSYSILCIKSDVQGVHACEGPGSFSDFLHIHNAGQPAPAQLKEKEFRGLKNLRFVITKTGKSWLS